MLTRRGFTLVEVVAALAISALMAAVLVPALFWRVADSEAGALVASLSGLSDGVIAYRADVGRYPPQLTYLTTPIASGTLDLCGIAVPNVNLWKGPYVKRSLPSSGVEVAGSTIGNTITRSPVSNLYVTTVAELVFSVTEVDESRALEVDQQLEGDALVTGGVRWTGPAGGRGTLTYRIPIRGC